MSTHFLRNSGGETIVDIEAMEDDIRCSIDIGQYTIFLLNLHPLSYNEWTTDISALQEIRGYYHENNEENFTSSELAESACKLLADKWNLYYIVD